MRACDAASGGWVVHIKMFNYDGKLLCLFFCAARRKAGARSFILFKTEREREIHVLPDAAGGIMRQGIHAKSKNKDFNTFTDIFSIF